MKRKTGELGWIQTTKKAHGDEYQLESFIGGIEVDTPQGKFVLCEQMEDIQTNDVTWRPIEIVEGKVET